MNNREDQRIISNVLWRFADKWGSQTISFLISVILSRIIDPDAFGIVVMVNAFIGIFSVFADYGLGSSLIQKKAPDNLDYSTAFVANFILCSIVYTIIFCISPRISILYRNNDLISLIRVSAISIIVSSYKNIQHAYVAKNLLFKKYFFSSIAGTIGAGIIGVVLALCDYGVWSLIISNLFDIFVDTIVSFFVVNWRFKISFSFDRLKKLSNFGIRIFAIELLNKAYDKLHSLVIGYKYTSADLAYFNKGETLSNKISETICYSINSVIFPALSNLQDNKEQLKEISKKTLQINCFILFPMLTGLASVSNNIIIVMLTEKWIDASKYLVMYCFIRMIIPFSNINNTILKSLGRSDLLLKNQAIERVIGILILLLTVNNGVIAIAYGLVFDSILRLFLDSRYSKKYCEYSIFEQLFDVFPTFVKCSIMFLFVKLVNLLQISIYVKLFVQVFVGILSYLIISILTNDESFYYLINKIKLNRTKQHM